MRVFQYDGRLVLGVDEIDFGISDIHVAELQGGGSVLFVLSRVNGEVMSWDLSGSGLPELTSHVAAGAQTRAGHSPMILVTEAQGDFSILLADIDAGHFALAAYDDGVQTFDYVTAGAGGWTTVTELSDGRIVAAAGEGGGFTIFDRGTNGNWSLDTTIKDKTSAYADDISLMETLIVGGSEILLVGSASEAGITAYTVTSSGVFKKESVGQKDGTGMLVPTDLTALEIGGKGFAILATAAGSAGALTVFEVTDRGGLIQTDHISDTLDTRFGSVQAVAATGYGGGALVVAGGGDDGLSLFALSPDGHLAHLSSLADSVESGLTNVSEIDILRDGDVLEVFVASEADAGVSVFRVDLTGLGSFISGDPQGGAVVGTTGDDILFGSSGSDDFYGGDGVDIFVITRDGLGGDVIQDFNLNEDRIDLSSWSFLYDVGSVNIIVTGQEARLEFRDYSLLVHVENTEGIDIEQVRASIDIDVTRLPEIEHVIATGDSGDNTIDGSWGQDTLAGGAGNDTLYGLGGDDVFTAGAGDDYVFGGNGTDTLVYDVEYTDVTVVAADDESITLQTNEGRDVVSGVEEFIFNGTTLTFDEVSGTEEDDPDPPDLPDPPDEPGEPPASGPLTLFGTENSDVFEYYDGAVQILAYGDDDTIITGNADDTLLGGAGEDTIQAGLGDDFVSGGDDDDQIWGQGADDVIFGGNGVDVLRGGIGQDTLYGGDGDDILRSQRDGDVLYGGDGDDNIKGGGGNDVHYGDDGSDFIKGGSRQDVLYGGTGDDILSGNSFDDALYGGAGDDVLRSGGDDDILAGGTGNDWLKGGTGADRFIFNEGDGEDLIVDFDATLDTLELSGAFLDNIESIADLVATYSAVASGTLQLDFGNGDVIVFAGLNSLADLSDAVEF